jgi:hypothetical protein
MGDVQVGDRFERFLLLSPEAARFRAFFCSLRFEMCVRAGGSGGSPCCSMRRRRPSRTPRPHNRSRSPLRCTETPPPREGGARVRGVCCGCATVRLQGYIQRCRWRDGCCRVSDCDEAVKGFWCGLARGVHQEESGWGGEPEEASPTPRDRECGRGVMFRIGRGRPPALFPIQIRWILLPSGGPLCAARRYSAHPPWSSFP